MSHVRSTLRGSRHCIACFYNLRHQPILHDDELNLRIVRCPECGQASSLTTHPCLGRSERTLSHLLRMTWILTALGLGILSALALFGVAIVSGYAAPHYTWNPATQDSTVSVSPAAFVMVAGAAASGALVGMFWRIVLFRTRGFVQRLVPVIILCAALALAWRNVSMWLEYGWSWDEGLFKIGAPTVVAAAGAMSVATIFGSFVGMAAARWCYRRLLLPARLQLALPF
jgi:hypothetical protein